jgi:hypothetical protein
MVLRKAKGLVMQALCVKIVLRFPGETDMSSTTPEELTGILAKDFMHECVYTQTPLRGVPIVRGSLWRDHLGDIILTLRITIGITGLKEDELPSSEMVARLAYSYFTITQFGVIRQVDYTGAEYRHLQGLHEIYAIIVEPPHSYLEGDLPPVDALLVDSLADRYIS